jgi:uncharacterized protein DUF4339
MTLYRIRGADEEEYGPIVPEEIRRWIGEGRVTAATLAQAEGDIEWNALGKFPEFAEALRRTGPPVIAPAPAQPQLETPESALGKVIPFQNPKAVTAYYLGLFAFVPVVGIALGLAAVILGAQGLLRANRNPAVRGHIHASVGILLGTVFGLCNVALLCFVMHAHWPSRF